MADTQEVPAGRLSAGRAVLAARILSAGRAHDADEPERDHRYRNVERDSARLLHTLVRAQGARSVVEIGTSNGYSTIWLADAVAGLPGGGRVVSVDNDAGRHAEARANLAEAGLAGVTELVLGGAGELLAGTGAGSVDLLFLDADRAQYVDLWPQLQRVMRPRGLLVVDNCVSHAEEVADFRALVDATEGVDAVLVPLGAGLLMIGF